MKTMCEVIYIEAWKKERTKRAFAEFEKTAVGRVFLRAAKESGAFADSPEVPEEHNVLEFKLRERG